MDKELLIDKLREHGIELVFVTDRTYRFGQIDMAREDYDIPAEAVVPTIEQYREIVNIVGRHGLYSVMMEYLKHGYLDVWSSSEASDRDSYQLYFRESKTPYTYDCSVNKSYGFFLAFWTFKETEEQKKIKHLEKTIAGLQKRLEALKNS